MDISGLVSARDALLLKRENLRAELAQVDREITEVFGHLPASMVPDLPAIPKGDSQNGVEA